MPDMMKHRRSLVHLVGGGFVRLDEVWDEPLDLGGNAGKPVVADVSDRDPALDRLGEDGRRERTLKGGDAGACGG